MKENNRRTGLTAQKHLRRKEQHTSVSLYASSAVHSAFAVGLLKAKIIGRSFRAPMVLITSCVNRRPAPATPGRWKNKYRSQCA